MSTTRTAVAFDHDFHLAGLDARQPSGNYVIDIDEQPIDGLTFLASRRIGAILYVPRGSTPMDYRHAVLMNVPELDAALSQSVR